MELWFAGLLGIVQGLTEFLPISSTAHLRVAPALLGQPDPGAAFSAVIQLGTLAAVIAYFFRPLFISMPRAMWSERGSPEARMPFYMAFATIPVGVAGLTFKSLITGPARSLYVVAAALAVVAVVMWAADRRGSGRAGRELASVTWLDAGLVGIAQAFAVVPGVSRSGATIAAALLLGLRRTDAARFSFLIGIPAIGAAGLYELREAAHALGSDAWGPIAVGTGAAFISGYASIAWLMRFLSTHTFTPFVIYRIALGAGLLALVGFGLVAAL